MKLKTIEKIITAKFKKWTESITDQAVKDLVAPNSIVTGGCIASMLLKEDVNDFDIYFTNKETAAAVAKYYVEKSGHKDELGVDIQEDRVRITKSLKTTGRGETVILDGTDDPETLAEIENVNEELKASAKEKNDDKTFKPIFISTNAITLSNKIQLVLRFFGAPSDIHANYDFVHCTNYWESATAKLNLRAEAMSSLLTKELRYVGSKYPVCSVIRLRKFLNRGWTINAGQIVKMCFHISELDLSDPKVIEDQLTGVDVAYFNHLIEAMKATDAEKITRSFLCEIIDKIF